MDTEGGKGPTVVHEDPKDVGISEERVGTLMHNPWYSITTLTLPATDRHSRDWICQSWRPAESMRSRPAPSRLQMA